MADRRKLQGEVDRCLKKVSEGVDAFEDIWQKVQNATNINQKEKYESELKKEIKKLQRLREQIKSWATSSDIKDKKTLLESRKLIELQMERFRVVEKETKTKAYSKEGLGQANKIDPETKEFEKCRDWVNEAISSLNIQIDQMEMEVESLSANTKKKKVDKDKAERTEELTERIKQHRFHIDKLEHILRLLDNESLQVDSVNKVKDDVEYYIENCNEPDFLDDEGLYDDLDLDNETELEPHTVRTHSEDRGDEDDDIHSSPSSSFNSGFSLVSASPAAKSTSGSPRKNSKNSSTPSSTFNHTNGLPSGTTTTVPTTLTTSTSKRNLFSTSSQSSTSSNTSSTSSEAVTTTANSTPMMNGVDHITSDINLTKSTTSSSGDNTTSTVPYASALNAVTTVSSSQQQQQQQQQRPPSPDKFLTSAEQNAVQVVRNHVESLKYPGFSSNNSMWKSSTAVTSTDSITTTISSSSSVPSLPKSSTEPIMTTQEALPSLLSTITRPQTTSATHQIPFPSTTSQLPAKIEDEVSSDFSLKANSLFGGVINPPGLPAKPNTADTQEVRLQPVHGVAPLGPVHLTAERLYQLKMLDGAFHHLPQKQDNEKMRPYISRSAVPIASYHHHQPPPNIDSLEFFQRLSTETLFFIFYYQEGTRAQYLAAKALKKQSWRFHTKYMMWFQRHEEPKRITDEFEETRIRRFLYIQHAETFHSNKEKDMLEDVAVNVQVQNVPEL